MSRVRELMRNPRVAAGVAAAAVLLSAYRIAGLGKKAEAPSAPAPAAASASPAVAPSPYPGAGAVPGGGALEPRAGVPQSSAPIPAEVAWTWDRNPFAPKGARGAARDGDAAPAAGDPGGGLPGTEGAKGGAPGDLRGTVVSGASGLAIFGTRLVAGGDRIGDWTLERVEHARVVLRRGTDTRVLEIFKPAPPGR